MKARLSEIGKDPDYADERKALEEYPALLDQQVYAKTRLKAAQEDLDAKYPKLSEVEIKTLMVDDKWPANIKAAVLGNLGRVSQTLTGRITNWLNATPQRCRGLLTKWPRWPRKLMGILERWG